MRLFSEVASVQEKPVKCYTAAVIGLGRIGQGYDYDRCDDAVIATHASAYARHPGYELLAAVDPDPFQRERFEAKFHRPAYADLSLLMEQHRPNVFSIAVPVDQHLPVFQDIIRYNPTAVICEKPIAVSVADARLMQTLAEDHQCTLAVNYIRRFEPGGIALRRIIRSGELGEFFKGIVWYSKGLLNNGSHFIDLLHFWLGGVTHVDIMAEGRRWDGLDPEPDVCIRFDKTPVYFLSGREECFSVGEINLFGSSGTIRYTDSGNRIEIRRTHPDPVFAGYTVLSPDKEIIPTDLKRYQWHVLEGLYNHLARKNLLASDGRSATETLAIIENIVAQRDRRANA